MTAFALAGGLFASAAHAAGTYSTFTGGDPGEGLDLQGNFALALDLAKDATDAVSTVGDAHFENLYGTSATGFVAPSGVVTGGTVGGAGLYDGYYRNADIGVGGPPNLGSSANDDALENVANSTWQTSFTISLTVGTPGARLVAGGEYKLQVLGLADADPNTARGAEIFIEGVSQGVYDYQAAGGFLNEGGVATIPFTATDNFNGNFGTPDGYISIALVYPGTPASAFIEGLTVEAVPEPASLSLLALGGLGLLRRRRVIA